MRICVWNIRPAQKPPCMKHWNMHMEHVIEWETVSRWMRQLSGTARTFKFGTGFSFPLCVCGPFTYWAPWSRRSATSKCVRLASFHNPLLLKALKRDKSGIKRPVSRTLCNTGRTLSAVILTSGVSQNLFQKAFRVLSQPRTPTPTKPHLHLCISPKYTHPH